MTSPFAERSHKEMKDVLMSPKSDGPKIHYYMIRGGKDKRNVTIWEPGTVGGEYIKSYGHYHVGDLNETYTVLAGEGFVILQKRGLTDDDIIEFRAVRVKAGDKVFIPSGYGHLAINTGNTWLVTSDDSPVDFGEKKAVSMPGHADYAPFKKLHGAAYYVVSKNGSPEFIKNPNYKKVPEIKFE
jgi:glucose-6-phosphate isomerase